MVYVLLAISIIFEVIGTSLLKKTEGFTQLLPTLGLLLCYAFSFYLISHVVKVLPVGIVYAIWSACGIVLISAVGYFVYKQALDLPAMIGIGFIIAGVVIVNLFSNVVSH